MLNRAKQWISEKRAELALRKYPRVGKYIHTKTDNPRALRRVVAEHGEWLEQTFKVLEDSGREDAVEKFAKIVRGYVQSNPTLIGRLKQAVPSDPHILARILSQTKMSKDHREMVGQLVLYGQIPDEARRVEVRKLLDVLDPEEQHLLWIKIHNHAMLRVPKAATRAVLDEIVEKRPDLKRTIERILEE